MGAALRKELGLPVRPDVPSAVLNVCIEILAAVYEEDGVARWQITWLSIHKMRDQNTASMISIWEANIFRGFTLPDAPRFTQFAIALKTLAAASKTVDCCKLVHSLHNYFLLTELKQTPKRWEVQKLFKGICCY
ncbi:hypothetical protein C5167_002870 [Papaver somniferum]|uniref:Uncharacterized protein n=1 Tax=Papaver somniferum TaxID=3469 RepID=A0A4Y7L2R9_PAPSO|nr:hypothetical protein C5167_002870 [Papaver somniferum]